MSSPETSTIAEYTGETYQAILDASTAMIWLSDANGHVTYLNQSWLDFVGRNLQDEIAREWTDDIHPDDRKRCLKQYSNGFASKLPFRHEYRLRASDGNYRWILEMVQPIRDHNSDNVAFVGTGVDISEQKTLFHDLEINNKELRRVNGDLERFAYVASHDLQEPLRKIQAFGEILMSTQKQNLSDDAQNYLQRMSNASTRMRRLIDDLLVYSRLNSQAKPFVKIDLSTEIAGVVSDLEIRIKETGAEIQVGELPTLEADRFQIQQLFQNLIGNALKFQRKDARPIVSIDSRTFKFKNPRDDSSSKEWCEVTVADNGIGFDEKYAERIFEAFQRLHTVKEFDGSGIGLAVCRRIVDRHGGSIAAHSKSQQGGAEFVILLPLAQAQSEDLDNET